MSVNVDFLVGESDDLLAAERSMHLEGKTNGNALVGVRSLHVRPERRYKHALGGGFELWPLVGGSEDT